MLLRRVKKLISTVVTQKRWRCLRERLQRGVKYAVNFRFGVFRPEQAIAELQLQDQARRSAHRSALVQPSRVFNNDGAARCRELHMAVAREVRRDFSIAEPCVALAQ